MWIALGEKTVVDKELDAIAPGRDDDDGCGNTETIMVNW